MQIIKTYIEVINSNSNYTMYSFMTDPKHGYPIYLVAYSKEKNFISNHFGATNEYVQNKLAYITLTSYNDILSISDEYGNTIIVEYYHDPLKGNSLTYNDEYIKNKYNMTTKEYIKLIKNNIKGNTLTKKLN